MSTQTVSPEKLSIAMNLLERAIATEMLPPDKTWFREYFLLTGAHMIETEESWISAKDYEQTDDQYKPEILDEVNAPPGQSLSFRAFRAKMLSKVQEGSGIVMAETLYIVAEVFSQGLHLTREGEDVGVFSFEVLKECEAILRED